MNEKPIAQLVSCTICNYETIRWVTKENKNQMCYKCKGLVTVIMEGKCDMY
jgi:hypothetical protein